MATTTFADMTKPILKKVIRYLPVDIIQRVRRVCSSWNTLINDEFPLEIELNNNNLQAMLLCGNAYKIVIKDLTAEIHENVAFANRARQLEAVGKVVTSNLAILLKICTNVEALAFNSLKEIMSIESMEVVEIPKVIVVQIKIRGEHQMFTLAELILFDWMTKRLRFRALEAILVKVCTIAEVWAQIQLDDNSTQGFSDSASTIYNLSRELTAAPSGAVSLNLLHPIPAQRNLTTGIPIEGTGENSIHESLNDDAVAENNSTINNAQLNVGSSMNGFSMNVNTSRITEATGQPEENHSETNTDSIYSYSRQSIFDGTMNRLERRFERNIEDDNGSMDLNEDVIVGHRDRPMDFYIYGGNTESAQSAVVSNSAFIRFCLKNFQTLKQLIVNARSDFLCFGNIAEFTLECNKLQFENLEYNFGRSVVYMEFMLLRTQRKLTRIRIQIIEDMIIPFLIALRSSSSTLIEIDLKIISFSENRQPFQYFVFSQCRFLRSLKILHFSGKAHLETLPISLEKLLMNGPLTLEDLRVIATRLVNLREFNLLMNMNVGIIDVELYKTFLKLPYLRMLSFVQCDLDVDGIQAFADSQPDILCTIEGPRNINSMAFDIQYVVTLINPTFNRELLN